SSNPFQATMQCKTNPMQTTRAEETCVQAIAAVRERRKERRSASGCEHEERHEQLRSARLGCGSGSDCGSGCGCGSTVELLPSFTSRPNNCDGIGFGSREEK